MGQTSSRTILQVRHALTLDHFLSFIGPILLAVGIAIWRVWRHISGAKDREEWRQWQKSICDSFEEARQELEAIKAEQKTQGQKIDTIGRQVQVMEGRFKQMDRGGD